MRVSIEEGGVERDLFGKRSRLGAGRRSAGQVTVEQRLDDLGADGGHRVEGSALQGEGGHRPPQLAQGGGIGADDLAPL